MLLIFWFLLHTVCGPNFKYIARTPYSLLIYINKTQWKLVKARCSLIFTLYVFACTCMQNNNKQKSCCSVQCLTIQVSIFAKFYCSFRQGLRVKVQTCIVSIRCLLWVRQFFKERDVELIKNYLKNKLLYLMSNSDFYLLKNMINDV